MHPDLFTLPGGFGVKSYGFMLMVGFLSAVWVAMRRAAKVKADPDVVLDLGFFSLIAGVAGSRIFYVIHYWESQFADAPNKLLAIVNITQGGLEFLGGFLGALLAVGLYSWWKKVSLRLYLDICAPSCMLGLAFGRLGCFMNGCCFGGLCLSEEHAHAARDHAPPTYSWAVEFPYGSPAFWRQWEDRLITVPAEMLTTTANSLQSMPLSASLLNMPVDKREGPRQELLEAHRAWDRAKAVAPEAEETRQLEAAYKQKEEEVRLHEQQLLPLRNAQRFPSRVEPSRSTTVTELQDIAAGLRSLPVHPTQLYAAIQAFLLCLLLGALFNVRRRHGVVILALLMLYPLQRFLLEIIRGDNPQDVAGFTISQFLSLSMVVVSVVLMFVLYRYLPERSPLAVPVARRVDGE